MVFLATFFPFSDSSEAEWALRVFVVSKFCFLEPFVLSFGDILGFCGSELGHLKGNDVDRLLGLVK